MQTILLILSASLAVLAHPGRQKRQEGELGLAKEGFPASNQPLVSCDQPFELSHVTNIESVGSPPAAVTEDGFQITFTQLAGNC